MKTPNLFSRKSIILIALFLLFPLFFFGQTLTGLWTGSLSNDSNTIRKDQSFEIALTEYRGKVYGYSRSEFIVDDTLYYVVKRVKGTIEGDVCEVTDDEIVAYNFRGKLDKGIKVTSTFRRNKSDSTWYLAGTWKTNSTKKYYSVTGKVDLSEEKDFTASKIFPHLEELNLANDIAFYKDRKEGTPIVKIAKPEKIKTEYSTKSKPIVTNNDVAVVTAKALSRAEAIIVEEEKQIAAVKKPIADLDKTNTNKPAVNNTGTALVTAKELSRAEAIIVEEEKQIAAVKKSEVGLEKTDTKEISQTRNTITPSSETKARAENKPVTGVAEKNAMKEIATNKPIAKKEISPDIQASNKPVKQTEKLNVAKTQTITAAPNNGIAKTNTEIKKPITVVEAGKTITTGVNDQSAEKKETAIAVIKPVVENKETETELLLKSAMIAGRKSEFSQIVNFKSDSLEISLYDNGEIDGDTVTIYMNGEVILSKQGLKASAVKKTIYLDHASEQFTLVMFAENLGKYAPNTGLLVVHDGDDVYNLRFSADLQKNAGIIFRRKK